MRTGLFASMDALTLLLLVLGATLLATSIVGLVVLAQPMAPAPASSVAPAPTQTEPGNLPLPADRVATVLRVDASAGAAGAARSGDHVDVLGYFSRQVTGTENVTRVLVEDVPVLDVAHDGGGAVFTLAVPQATALLLHEAQALGARPFVVVRSESGSAAYPPSLSDSELVGRLATGSAQQVTANGR